MAPLPALGLALAAAACLGAAGLAGEVLLLAGLDLSLGTGRGAAVGLAVWLAAWAVGAFLAGRTTRAPRAGLLLGAAVAALGLPLAQVAALGSHPLPALLGLAATAGTQGWLLPLLVRTVPGRGRFALLWAANLAGGVAGVLFVAGDVAAEHGRVAAGFLASGLVLAAGALGALAAGRGRTAAGAPAGPAGGGSAPDRTAEDRPSADPDGAPSAVPPTWAVAAVVALGTGWMALVQTAGLRLGSLDLSGMQPALEAVLAASLSALALGSLVLPPLVPRDLRGVRAVLLLGGVASLWFGWPAVHEQVHGLRARPLLAGLVLVGPPLLPFGALVPCLHRALRGESGRRLGDLLLHEAWGALLVSPALVLVVLPRAGLDGALAAAAALGALAAAVPPRPASAVRAWAAPLLLAAVAGAWWVSGSPARRTPVLDNPAFTTRAFAEDVHFSVSVVDDGVLGERTLLTDGFRATATGDDYLYMRALGHVPLLLHPDPERVAVLAFGTGTTAGAVSLHPEVRELDVLELSARVIEFAPHFAEVNRDVLDDPRTRVLLGDGRRALAARPGHYQVVTMEPLLPDAPAAVHLYTREFYGLARAALAEGGILCQWVPPHALRPDTFEAVVGAFTGTFEWSAVLQFGTQLLLVGSDRVPVLDPARFPGAPLGANGASDPGASDPGSDAPPALREALAALGLGRPAGVLGRWVCDGDAWPEVPRPLTDADPWVLHARAPRGAEALGWLPRNLERLARLQDEPPLAWRLAADDAALQRSELLRAVREVRRRHEVERARALGWPAEAPVPSSWTLRAELEARAPDEPELVHLGRLMDYQTWRTEGVRALAGGDALGATDRLSRAAELRPACGDVHLFLALALLRQGLEEVATLAARTAFERCPRLLETPQGQVARSLDPVGVERLRALARK